MALPSIKNRVGNAVTSVASSGTGTITLDTAETGYQSFATAYGANVNVDILIEEGSTWEIARDCTYTHSGTTVTRGTLESSSTGSAVTFTSAAKVYVIESAERIRRAQYLEHASHDGTAAVTGVVGTLHVFTALTADRTFTLPAAAAAGDRIGVTFPAGSASYEVMLKSASGDKINNVDCSSTEWSRLFIAGEIVIFRCVDGSTVDWVVEHDGRIESTAAMKLTTDATAETAATLTLPTDKGGVWTTDHDVGGLNTTSTGTITVRRSGKYDIVSNARSVITLSDQKYFQIQVLLNGATELHGPSAVSAAVNVLGVSSFLTATQLSAGDYIQLRYRSEEGSKGCRGSGALTQIGVTEVL